MIPKDRMVQEAILGKTTPSSPPHFLCPFYPISTHLLRVTKFMSLSVIFPLFIFAQRSRYIFNFLLFLTQRVIYYKYFCTLLISPDSVSWKFFHISSQRSYLQLQSTPLSVPQFIQPLLCMTVCVSIYAITNNAAVNILLQLNFHISSG